jgi:alkanesulfonate monooxygenase SsuD/methylene tetrahydromethanopterin reductase-like flavin-dependent oxidoreductase (luciferase family)
MNTGQPMKFGITIPNFGDFGNARRLGELAATAEQSGWDGCFVWDHIRPSDPSMPLADPWISATTMALRTERIRIGPLVTPLPRRRPWQVARQAVTLDHLSGGRLVLGIGLGGDWNGEYLGFGEAGSKKERGAMLDEAIEIIAGLWSGEPFSFQGDHYQVNDVTFLPKPLQEPRIPVWVAGVWPNRAPFRRAARWDGVFPIVERESFAADSNEIREILAYIAEFRESNQPQDVIVHAESRGVPEADLSASISALSDAGVTWWLQTVAPEESFEATQALISTGPPR